MSKPIYVTQPYSSPLDEFISSWQQIWDKEMLTIGGMIHQQVERTLCDYLGVEHLALFANGAIVLVTALQALRITGEVNTTLLATSNYLIKIFSGLLRAIESRAT